MRNGQNRALVGGQVFFQPKQSFHVQVVGRFVQNQEFGVFQQQPTQLQTGLFAPRHRVDGLVVHAFKAHTVEHGADFYFVVVAVARRNLLVEIFVLCGKSAVFVAPFFCLCK